MKTPKDSRPANGFIVTGLMLLLLLSVYVGAYYGTVQRTWRKEVVRRGGGFALVLRPPSPTYGSLEEFAQRYRMPSPTWFFTPIHMLDRRLRHEKWEL